MLFMMSILLLICCDAESVTAATSFKAAVKSVYDGDTVTAIDANQNEFKIRLLWIDTPEVSGNAHGAKMPEGVLAREFLRTFLPVNAQITVWFPNSVKTDAYGRYLAVVLNNGKSAQEAIIRAGWSPIWWKYGKPAKDYRQTLQVAEDQADADSAGAWGTARAWMTAKGEE